MLKTMEVFGPNLTNKILLGCKFTYLQSAQKVAILVTKTQNEELIFIYFAKKIPDCESKEHVQLVFRVPAGTTKPSVAITPISKRFGRSCNAHKQPLEVSLVLGDLVVT